MILISALLVKNAVFYKFVQCALNKKRMFTDFNKCTFSKERVLYNFVQCALNKKRMF